MMTKLTKLMLPILLLTSCLTNQAISCTQWASIGEINQQGDTLFAKNRDADLNGSEQLIIQHGSLKNKQHSSHYSYLALSYNQDHLQSNYPYITWGINSQGLLVSVTSATTTPVYNRDFYESQLMRKILSYDKNIDQVLKNANNLFSHDNLGGYLLADGQQILLVEVGPNGNYHMWHTKHGYLYHTNHYIAKQLKKFNSQPYPSTYIRYKTIGDLLKQQANKKFTAQLFKQWLHQQHHGLNNSLRRKYTLAHIIAILDQGQAPQIHIEFTDIHENKCSYQLTLNHQFWQQKKLAFCQAT